MAFLHHHTYNPGTMADDLDLDRNLELVRRGFDPTQVQRLVGSLSDTLKALTAENETLRERLAEVEERKAAPKASSPADDVISVWSRETTELLDAARHNVARVMERATADGEALVVRADAEAAAIREKAAADSERVNVLAAKRSDEIVSDANVKARTIVGDAEQLASTTVADADQQAASTIADAGRRAMQSVAVAEASAAQVVADADAHRAEAEAEAQMAVAAGAAKLDQLSAKFSETKRQLAEMEAARRVLRDQLRGARNQLDALVTLADDTPTSTKERANDQR